MRRLVDDAGEQRPAGQDAERTIGGPFRLPCLAPAARFDLATDRDPVVIVRAVPRFMPMAALEPEPGVDPDFPHGRRFQGFDRSGTDVKRRSQARARRTIHH